MIETVETIRASEPEFDALFRRVCAAGTDDKWWFGRAYDLVGGLALLQNPWELAALCLLLRREASREVYLEIGSAGGGTCRFLHQEVGFGRVLAMDDGKHPRAAEQEGNFEAIGGVERFVGNSHSWRARRWLRRRVGGRDLDIVLVDGDHSRRGVAQDVELVLAHCRPEALLILHDIHEVEGVRDEWRELVARGTVEPVAELLGVERPMGIGVGRVAG